MSRSGPIVWIMSAMDDAERIHPESIEQWRDWLAEHHAATLAKRIDAVMASLTP